MHEGAASSGKSGTTKSKQHLNGKATATSPLDPNEKMPNGMARSSREHAASPGSSTGELEGEGSESAVAGDSIHVAVRVRPLSPAEKTRRDKNIVKVPEEGSIWIDNNLGQRKPFTFNKVFADDSGQDKVFNECGIKHLIDMALEGYSCTVLAFGQTGSGKTYTLTGPVNLGSGWEENSNVLPAVETSGLMQRSFRYLIEQMGIKKSNFTLKASYVEIYNEKVQDLLELSSSRDSLVVRWSADRGFYVEDLFCVKCESEDDLMAVLEEGLRNRQVRAHCINDHSSRSHCLLTLHVDSEIRDPEYDADFVIVKYGRLCFVDLAGNERVKETKTTGEVLTESQNINKSLLTLGNCISALSDAKKRNGYIPYRDSKLTKLLAKSLGGDGMTLMIACISPSSSLVSDTLNTLRYAQRAKKIKNKPVVQMDPKERLILSLKREIKLLRKENIYFKAQLGLPTPLASSRPTTNSESWTTDDGGENLTDTPLSTDDENRTPTPWETLSASMSTRLPPGLYDMLQEYMVENENLRTENGDLYTSRDTMRRQNIVISRENDVLLKKLEQFESRSSSAVSSSSRIPSGLRGIRSLTHPSTSDSSTINEETTRTSPGSSISTSDERSKDPSHVVSLPPVRQTRSNPIAATSEKTPKTIRQQQSQQTLLNIKKDVEWLAKQQSLQKSNSVPYKSSNSEVETSSNEDDGGSKERIIDTSASTSTSRSLKITRIPQRVKEPSSYTRIFAKHKASQPKKAENDIEWSEGSVGEPSGTNMDFAGPSGAFAVPSGAPVTRQPGYNYHGRSPESNEKLREDLDNLANQIEYYRSSYTEPPHGIQKNRAR